jgi:hypothetical protein
MRWIHSSISTHRQLLTPFTWYLLLHSKTCNAPMVEKSRAIPKGIRMMEWLTAACSSPHGLVSLHVGWSLEFEMLLFELFNPFNIFDWCWARLLQIMMDILVRTRIW